MKRSRVVVPWPEGLHLRPATRLVRLAQDCRSKVFLRRGDRIADLRSILSVLALCATLGTPLDIEAVGEDERYAAAAVEQMFSVEASATDPSEGMPEPRA